MNVYVIGLNYKSAPIDIRERFHIAKDDYERVLSVIKQVEGVAECALLSTCNRTEFHIFSDGGILKAESIESRLCEFVGMAIYPVKRHFYVYEGMQAIRHIMKVASGMDSMILGEDHVLGQFKKAYAIAMHQGASSAVLNTLSRLAITSAKKIKTHTLQLGKTSSAASKAVDLLTQTFGVRLKNKKILIIGSGEIGTAVSEALLKQGVSALYMTQRSGVGAGGSDFGFPGAKRVKYEDRYLFAGYCDIIVGATASPHYTITRDVLEKHIHGTVPNQVFVDLAVPRDFDEAIGQMAGVCLYNIDDLKKIHSAQGNGKPSDLQYVHTQIHLHTEEFIRWYEYRNTLSLAGGG